MTERPAANPQRGETSFIIGGQTYCLRPSFENLVAVEEDIGPLFAIVDRAASGGLTLAEMRSIIWHCILASDRPEREAVGKAILNVGMVEAAKPIRVILSQVLQGRR